MKKYEFLEHTADVFIVGNGKTLEEAFQNCALGLSQYMVNLGDVEKKIQKKIMAKGTDLKSLLVEFLTQFLILHDSENLVFSSIKVTKFDDKNFEIEAIIEGEEFDPEKHKQGTLIKAITYHELEIKEKEGIYSVKVLVDI
ncbi:MAG: archease [Candidatus Pacearchaeota archaeon]|nr:MAG: archease [Candidatus Pacearchaeota archaeon]